MEEKTHKSGQDRKWDSVWEKIRDMLHGKIWFTSIKSKTRFFIGQAYKVNIKHLMFFYKIFQNILSIQLSVSSKNHS